MASRLQSRQLSGKEIVTNLSFSVALRLSAIAMVDNGPMLQSEKAEIGFHASDAQLSFARTQILVIEDDPQMQKVLQRVFRDQGYGVTVCGDGKAGLDAFHSIRPSAVVLDLVLPNIFGRDLCRMMKGEQPGVPVIVVSAISEVADKVLLLELGADDYVTKPFSPRELMARVQAALRRPQKQAAAGATYSFGACEIDFAKMSARRAGKPITLTAHEFKLLRYFVGNAERVLSREELLNEVWGYNSYPTTRTVDNQILKLRQKLEPDSGDPHHLQTVYGAGYRFVP
jgi:DNA-binding response OmpR family regulator